MNRYKIVMLLLAVPLSLQAQAPQALFEQANGLYKQGKFVEAIKLYRQIPNKSAQVEYNLGNCAYKLKRYGWALLHWRRAERTWGFFNRDELVENILHLKKELYPDMKMGLPIITKIKNIVLSWSHAIPLLVLQLLFLLLWLFLFVYLRFLYKKRKNRTILGLFALIAFFGILLVIRYSLDARRHAVVVSPQSRLLSGPGETFQMLMPLGAAQEVIIKKETADYYKVKALKRIGWINKNDIQEVLSWNETDR